MHLDLRKALTVRAPWAGLIALGLKLVENRSQRTNYRGPLYIHVGLEEHKDGEAFLKKHMVIEAQYQMDTVSTRRGGLIAVVDLIGCDQDMTDAWYEIPGMWHWRLANAKLIPFERMAGAQGIWTVGNQKRVVELPDGFTTKTNLHQLSGSYRTRLYRDGALLCTYSHENRIESARLAAAHAHQIAALPAVETIGKGCCDDHDTHDHTTP